MVGYEKKPNKIRITLMSRKYKTSPIIEALCQFQFGPDTTWDLTIPGLVYEKVKNTFPNRNQVAQINIGLAANAQIIGQQIGALPLMQFLSENGNTLMQVGQNLLTINQLNPYSSWEEFLPLIEQGLKAYEETAHPKNIQRIALQYLNRFEFENPIKLEDYLNFYPFLGKELPQDFGVFVVGVQIPFEDSFDLMNLQLTTVNSETPNTIAMILDLNYVLIKPENITLVGALEWVDKAHKHVEDIFEACITDQMRQRFQEVKE